jgi:NitT/TauT family transport system substrate-binding protein
MNKTCALLIGLIATVTAERALAETLKVAVAQRGFWNSTFIDVGLKQGYFKDVGLDIDILYTEGGASTLTPVIAGSIDIAMTNGILGVVAAYAKGMPVKIISAEATGAADAFWYARPDSGITRLADTNGKTVAFSSPGSSTNLILLQLVNQAKVTPKLVATGGAPATLTQVMSGQIDVGWSAPPFGLDQLDQKQIRIIATGNDADAFKGQTVRLLITNTQTLRSHPDVIKRFMKAYRETVDMMYAADPAALKIYADWLGITPEKAMRTRDGFFPKTALDPDKIIGIDAIVKDAVALKYTAAALTKDQLADLIQIPPRQ